MPLTKASKSNKVRKPKTYNKSHLENIKPEVLIKPKQSGRVDPTAPTCDENKKRHLSVVDANKKGSKSSVSDAEDIFYTAVKDTTYLIDEPSHERKFCEKPNQNPNQKVTREKFTPESDLVDKLQVNSVEEVEEHGFMATVSTTLESFSNIKLDVCKSQLPDNVVNIEVEDGLYEYSKEIVEYLFKFEMSTVVPRDFLDDGCSVTHNMRSILVDWLIQVQHHLKLCQETLYLGVGILDQVLYRRDVDPDKLQLVGVTSLLVASKLEEYYPVDIKKLLHLTENSYTRAEVTQMERVLLDVLEFQVYLPSPQVFLLRNTRACFRLEDPEFLKTCQYLLDAHLAHSSHPCSSPSLLAAAAVFSASVLYSLSANTSPLEPNSIWTPTLVHYTTYELLVVVPIGLEMVEQVLDATLSSSKLTGAFVKYKSYSQHQRLALAKHLQVEVLEQGRKVMENWV